LLVLCFFVVWVPVENISQVAINMAAITGPITGGIAIFGLNGFASDQSKARVPPSWAAMAVYQFTSEALGRDGRHDRWAATFCAHDGYFIIISIA
jgi:hypothetical protein